jgi:hypothetical protein
MTWIDLGSTLRRLGAATLPALCLLASACGTPATAMVRGQRLARPSFGYTDGRYFAFNHLRAHPAPLDPQRERIIDDGSIEGRACGLDLIFYPTWTGQRVLMQGWGRVAWSTSTSSRDTVAMSLLINEREDGSRTITGTADMKDTFPVELDVGSEHLRGTIGQQHFDLAARDDLLVGRMTMMGSSTPYAIAGRSVLRSMPPTDEALLLIAMMTCTDARLPVAGRTIAGFALAK